MVSIPSAVIQHIALFIQDASDFFSFLTCFDDETLGDLQHFLKLSSQMSPTDLWPKLQLRQLTSSLVPSIRCITRFFTTISVFEVYDVSLLRECLHPHNRVDLLSHPPRNEHHAWLTAPLSMLPVHHITFQAPEYATGDLFVEQLGNMPDLVSLTLQESHMHTDSMDRLFAFLQASSKLTRLSLSSLYVSDRTERNVGRVMRARPPHSTLQRRQLEVLTAWLRRCPVTSFELDKWLVDDGDQTSAVEFLDTLFGSSTLEDVTISYTPLGRFLAMVSFVAPIRMQSLALTRVCLTGASMAKLAAGLRHSSITSLSLEFNTIEHNGLQLLLDVLPESNIEMLCLRRMGLDDDACTLIAAVLPSSKIVKLDLSGNTLTDCGAEELCKVIDSLITLTSLHLSRNRITLQGATDLVKALTVQPQLKIFLDESGKSIQDMDHGDLVKMFRPPSKFSRGSY
ncbi:unnamed protein product [Aphanomyces euteiches]